MKKLFLLMLMGMCLTCRATDVLVKTKDGGDYTFTISHRSQITFSGTELIVHQGETTHNFQMSNVSSIKYDNVPDGIRSITSVGISSANGKTVVRNLKKGEKVNLYNTNGVLVSSATADANGVATVNTATLSRGVYVLETRNKSYKMVKQAR